MKTMNLLNISCRSLILTILLSSCTNTKIAGVGITYIAPRGKRPPAQSIVWSPIDENKVLINAYEFPTQPAEVYILDIQTGQKETIVGPLLSATFIEARWSPDGRKILLFAEDHTPGFERAGWWAVDLEHNNSLEYQLGPNDAAWSPNGKMIAALVRKKVDNSISISLKLIENYTKDVETITDYKDADHGSGLSWSPDGQYVVFSVGKYGSGASSLYILHLDTREVTKFTQTGYNVYPSWSPKGNIIAFRKYFPDKLYLIRSDGECEVEIPNLENVWSPTWSPDGKKLGYIGLDGIYYLDIEKVLGRDIYENLCQ